MAACPEPNPESAAIPILADETAIPRRHPKTGERRRARRFLRLDTLPPALLDRIRSERAKGHTWHEIERASPSWPEWEQATPEVLAGFPDRRLPHSNLQRWHDLRVEQVQREREGQAAAAQAFAARLGARRIANLGSAVKDALGESVFRLAAEGADEQLVRDELCRLAQVIAGVERGEIARQKLELAGQQALVARLLVQKDMDLPTLNRFLTGLEDSPVFQSYIEAQSELRAARRAAEPPESEDYCDVPDDDPEPQGSAGALARGLQSTTNSWASQPAAGGAASDDQPEPDDQPAPDDDSELRDEDAGDDPDPDDDSESDDQAGLEDEDAETEEADNPPCPAISRDLPRESAPPAHQPRSEDDAESDDDPEPRDEDAQTEEADNPPYPAISRDFPRESAPRPHRRSRRPARGGDGLSNCLRTPLKPLPLSGRYPPVRLRLDPPTPGRDPRAPCRPESEHRRRVIAKASPPFRFRSRATAPCGND